MNDLQKLIIRGMRGFFTHVSDEDKLKEVARGVKSKEYKLFVVGDSAYCILYLPQRMLDSPQVLHFYSEKRAQTRLLTAHVLDFVKKNGYNKLVAINGSGIPDKQWKRVFRHEGWKISPAKTVFEFEEVK